MATQVATPIHLSGHVDFARYRHRVVGALLGRTNLAFPPVWLSLRPPVGGDGLAEFVAQARSAKTVLDLSIQPGLLGGQMRGGMDLIALTGSRDYERATDSTHAIDLVQANLIQLLSAVGRETMDFFFLPVRSNVEEFQISGALEALESARQDGHIRFVGLQCVGSPFATLGLWQFHDAFDVVRMPVSAEETLAPLARERRVGVITEVDSLDNELLPQLITDHPVIVPVSSIAEVQTAQGALASL